MQRRTLVDLVKSRHSTCAMFDNTPLRQQLQQPRSAYMTKATAAFCTAAFVRTLRTSCGSPLSPRGAPRTLTMSSRKTPATPPPEQSDTPEQMLFKDLERIRAKRRQSAASEKKKSGITVDAIKSAIDMALLANFFLVIALLGWLGVALIPHFAAKNDVLLDPWLGLWGVFIQPVLGVLMLGTVIQGTLSYINSRD